MLGNAMAGITISIMVLDRTESAFLYALFLVCNNAPKILTPFIAGPLLDRFSRKKAVCLLDYMSGGLYYAMFVIISLNSFSVGFLLAAVTVFGALDSVYGVAYDSLYPNIVSRENYTKAYSVASMLYPLAAAATPLGALLYRAAGIAPILFINAATFFFAAFAESCMDVEESHVKRGGGGARPSIAGEFAEGVRYIAGNRGLSAITVYFCLNMFCDSTQSTLVLPYFKGTAGLSELLYTFMIMSGVAGRLLGGGIHYRYKYPAGTKFLIACFVYAATCMMDGAMLFVPLAVMMIFQFLSGLMGVTSYNIRVSAIQSSIPDGCRARLNSVFSVVYAAGSIAGQLVSGAVAEIIPLRSVVVVFSSLNLLLVFAVVLRNARYIKPIYNREI
jgi:MFS family permease